MLKTAEKIINIPECVIESQKGKTKKAIYGMELILELFGCDINVITSKKKIEEYIISACDGIKMERYGKPMVKKFPGGELWGVGYSFLQFLTTSSMAGHFINDGGIAFLNIFSCKEYDAKKAAEYAESFFRPKKIKSKLIIH